MRLDAPRHLPLLALLAAPLMLTACGKAEEPSYEAGATDESGGQLIVEDASSTGVPVQLPETPMTPVPADSGSPAPEASATP